MTGKGFRSLPEDARERFEAIVRAVGCLAPEARDEAAAAAAWLAVQVRTGMLSALTMELVAERQGVECDFERDFAPALVAVCAEYADGWKWLNWRDRPMDGARS